MRLKKVKKTPLKKVVKGTTLQEFEKLSGVPVLINTSLNISGDPIVCTPQDAYDCLIKTKLDYMVIGNFLIKGSSN